MPTYSQIGLIFCELSCLISQILGVKYDPDVLLKGFMSRNNCWIQTEIWSMWIIFDLQEQDMFIMKVIVRVGKCEAWSWLCALWWMPSETWTRETPVECAESTDSSYAKQVPPPHFPWCNCSRTRKSQGLCETQYSTWWLPPEVHDEWMSKKPFQMDYCMSFILTERWIYLSLCLLLQWRGPLNVQCNSILSVSSPRMGVTFCLCFTTHEYMLTSTCVCIRVFVNIHVCKNMCMLTFI